MRLISKFAARCSVLVARKNTSSEPRVPSHERGIALLLVIGAILILTMIGVEFAYDAQVEYHLAVHQKERLQAYYLALSAYNLVRLELKMGSAVQSQVASAISSQNIQIPFDLSTPLCQQFPMKTALFRLAMSGDAGAMEEKPEDEKNPKEKKPDKPSQNLLASLPLQGVEEFLQFNGDFDGECVDESSKIDLNFFYAQNPSQKIEGKDNSYDEYKKFLIALLSQEKYQELFKKLELKIPEVVRNIADFVDPNESINEFGGSEGGSEDSEYRGGISGQMTTKNGKFSVPSEIYEVPGVDDSWWIPVSDLFTIYGMASEQGKPQINVCRAPNEVVRALILRYTQTRTDLPPLKAEDDEILGQLVKTVKGGCTGAIPDKNKIANDLDAKLLELLKATPATPSPGQTGTAAGGYGANSSTFADWIATTSRFFSLKLIGQVNDTAVTIKSVMDMGQGGGGDTTKWKTVYWKVE